MYLFFKKSTFYLMRIPWPVVMARESIKNVNELELRPFSSVPRAVPASSSSPPPPTIPFHHSFNFLLV